MAVNYAHSRPLFDTAWAHDESVPLLPGVEVIRNAIEPAWSGDLAAKIQAELNRRTAIIKGAARGERTYRCAGLLRCAVCGYAFVHHHRGYYYCNQPATLRKNYRTEPLCPNRRFLKDSLADRQIKRYLERWARLDEDAFTMPDEDGNTARLVAVTREIAAAENKLDQLIVQKATAPANIQHLYTRQIEQASAHLDALSHESRRLEALQASPRLRYDRNIAWQELREQGLKALFEADNRQINQFLHRLMRGFVFLVNDGQIVDYARR